MTDVFRYAKGTTAAPLIVTISDGSAGVTGLSPTVAIRDTVATPTQYFDFADGTFKASGWTTEYAAMSDRGGGVYQYMLNVAAASGIVSGMILSAEYAVLGFADSALLEIIDLQVHVGRAAELDFLARYPDFRSAGTLVTAALADATRRVSVDVYGAKADQAIGLLTAHLLAVSLRLVDDTGSTRYIKEFEALRKEVAPNMIVV